MPLQDGDCMVVGGDGARGGRTVALDLGRGQTKEAGSLAGVRGENEAQGLAIRRPARLAQGGERSQAVGIDNGARGGWVAYQRFE